MSAHPTTDELADLLAETHRDFYRNSPRGEIAQSCLIIGADETRRVIQCGWHNAAEREIILAGLRMIMVLTQATRYAVWGEVWMVYRNSPPGVDPAEAAEKAFAEYENGDLSRDPERIECVFTLVVEASGKSVQRIQKIIRGRSGGVRTLVAMEPMDGLGGALGDLMPERTFN